MFKARWFHLFLFFLDQVDGFDQQHRISACTTLDPQQTNQTFVRLLCSDHSYILVQNVTFGVRRDRQSSICNHQIHDCVTRTTSIGTECNGLTECRLDLNPQYLHICSQYSDYMILDYRCLQGQSLSVCDQRSISTSDGTERVFLRSPNYPDEYTNALHCSCRISSRQASLEFLDFYLEERDEIDECTRDYLQIDQRALCDGDVSSNIELNSSMTRLIFQTNDVITRKGFWLSMSSAHPMEISCGNASSSSSTSRRPIPRFTLFFILLIIIILIIFLLFFNFLFICLCWKQRRIEEMIESKSRHSSSSSSSMPYHQRSFPFPPHFTSDRTPSSSMTTTAYDDPQTLIALPRRCYPMACHCSEFYRTSNPFQQHIYETIQVPYQQFRQATFHQEEQTDAPIIESHPETLV